MRAQRAVEPGLALMRRTSVTIVRVPTAGLVIALLLTACSSRTTDDDDTSSSAERPPATAENGGLSSEELAFAQELVLNSPGLEDATISSATAVVRHGIVTGPNVGAPCTSGRLIKIRLIGRFPHIVTTGHPVGPGEDVDFTVTGVLITADAETGDACLQGVRTGEVSPAPGAEIIPLD